MSMRTIQNMSPGDLEIFLDEHREGEYLLVDVRQPGEYRSGHIPGALHLPLSDIESVARTLNTDIPAIFYCHSGRRSLAAAQLLSDRFPSSTPLYSLTGGIMAWQGNVLDQTPRIEVFGRSSGMKSLLATAMDMEKGAWILYSTILQRWPGSAVAESITTLAGMERAHARVIYQYWKATQDDPPRFDHLFTTLEGSIVEGGRTVAELLDYLAESEEPDCLRLAELALEVESQAFDLYRVMAQQAEKEDQKVFLDLAEQEKDHIRLLSRGLPRCDAAS